MSLFAENLLFADVPTSFDLLKANCKQLKYFPIIKVVIEELDQQFAESIAEKHFVIVLEFFSTPSKSSVLLKLVFTRQPSSTFTTSRDALEFAFSPVLPKRSASIISGVTRCTLRNQL